MIARRSWLGINSAHDRIKSDTPHVAKPDPRVYHLTCDRMQLKPFEAVLLDDVPANLEAARAVGMQAVLHRGRRSRLPSSMLCWTPRWRRNRPDRAMTGVDVGSQHRGKCRLLER